MSGPGAGAREDDGPDARVRRRLARLMAARLGVWGVLFAVALALGGVDNEAPDAARHGLQAALAAGFVTALGFALGLRWIRGVASFGAVQIPTDVAIATALVHFTGGDQSPFGFLYLLLAVFGAMVAGSRGAFGAAALGAAAHGAMLAGVQYGWLPDWGDATPAPGPVVLAFWSLHAAALALVALLASHLSRELASADAALDQSRSRLRVLRRLHERTVESLMSGLLTTDPEGRITSFNREAERITGVAVGEALGCDIDEVIPGARALVVAPAVERGPAARLRERMPYRNRRGAALHLGLSGSILRDEEDRPSGSVVIFQDLTQVVEMEGELRRSERLAAVGKLAADIAHEVRNPLAAISGSIQMLVAGGTERRPVERERLVEIVLRETDRLSELLTDFLQYAHPRPPQPEPVAISSAVDEVLRMLRHAQPKDVVFEADVPPELRVLADPAQIRQLLWNLCVNAVQAMPAGGRVTVAARAGAEPPQETPAPRRNAGRREESAWVEIRVADTGAGIPADICDRIFDPFFTTKQEGTGLGLATVHRIVEGNGGLLRVESALGMGTTFWIWLPAAEEAP